MRFLFPVVASAMLILACNHKDDAVAADAPCLNNGPIAVDSGGSYFTLPSAFTPNGDGLNDAWFAFTDNIDTADFSLRVMENDDVHFATQDPYFQWLPGQFIRQRKEFDVEVQFRVRNGALVQACGRLTIPKQDSFFTCAEDIDGLYFADQVNIANGAFELSTAEQECP